MNSKVLIAGLNGANTELAKNLVLTAINLDIADSKEISQDILDKNFLFGPNHLGQKVCDAAVNVLTPMNPLIKITAISDASTSSILDSATLTVSHFTFSKHMERTPHFLTLALGLSAVAFLRPSLESPSLERSLELLQNGTYEISAELGAIILMSKEKISRSDLIHMDDLELTNLLGNSKLDQTTIEKPQAKIKRLLKDWESECCPVYSVIGSILSQEVVNFFKDADQVISGWLVYDSLVGTAKMLGVAQNSK